MGVIKTANELFGFGQIEPDEEEYLEPLVTSSEDEQVTPTVRRRIQRVQTPLEHNTSIQEAINNRRKGQKQARRMGNLRELINMVEKEDLELDFNIFEPGMSAFAELFMEREKMQAWNDFVNSSEEEQEDLLQTTRPRHSHHHHDNTPQATEAGASSLEVEAGEGSWEMIPDKRAAHPSFTAEECFMRLNKDLRLALNRRHKPMGLLSALEQDIVSFFRDSPSSVYISKLSSSYERMILHAICQYLDLTSNSFDVDGHRHTQVENKNATFSPPNVLLTEFLENKAAALNHGNLVTST